MSTATLKRWQRLAKLAAAAVHAEERALSAANQNLSLAQSRERLLRDHALNIKQAFSNAVVPVQKVTTHQRFGTRLAGAIEEQAGETTVRLQERQKSRSSWLAARKRQKAFEQLAERAAERIRETADRNERRQLDEFRTRPQFMTRDTSI